jgi:regulator of sigma E protease
MLTFIVFILILGVLVLIHELGHFSVAKFFKVHVEEFAFGFPPTLWSKLKKGTRYMINLIPFGGYVKLLGEDGTHEKDPHSFSAQTWWKKCLIVLAGVVMNLLLGGLLVGFCFMLGLPTVGQENDFSYPGARITQQVYVSGVQNDSNFSKQLQGGDEILSLNDQNITTIKQFKEIVQAAQSAPLTITVKRGRDVLSVSGQANFNTSLQEWISGLEIIQGQTITLPWYLAIPFGFVEVIQLVGAMILALWTILQNLVVHHQAPSQIAGPIGIYKLAGVAVNLGLVHILQLTAILSINLAIINVLPIPALDGGRILFILGEKITRRKLPAELENTIHLVGFAAIIGILILVTISDVRNFF